MVFIERFQQVANSVPNLPAIIVDGEPVLSYSQLWDESFRIAIRLRKMGAHRESLVALKLEKSPAFISSLLGVWISQAAWLPVEPSLPKERIELLLKDSQAEFVIEKSQSGENENFNPLEITRTGFSERKTTQQTVRETIKVPPNQNLLDLAYVIYTSGSTGSPKGVEVTHSGLVSMLEQQINVIGIGPGWRSLFLLSTSFDASISDIGTALLSGAAVCIETKFVREGRFIATAQEVLDVIDQRAINYVDIPPALLAKLPTNQIPKSLKTLLIGGEVCPPEVVRYWAKQVRLINVYGPTEATICTSLSICDSKDWDRPLIGRPLEGVDYVVDRPVGNEDNKENFAAVEQHGELLIGELLIGGKLLARGYRNRPDLTQKQFVTRNQKRYYRTGDRVRMDPDGEFVFLGRMDRQIKLRGHRIEPGEIERTLAQHPAIDQCAVLKRVVDSSSGKWVGSGEVLVGFVQRCENENQHEETKVWAREIQEFLKSKIPSYSIPQHFEFLKSLPTTNSGKVDLQALSHLELTQLKNALASKTSPLGRSANSSQPIGSNDSFEQQLREVFGRVLGHRAFDDTDHFLSVGGDSLKIIDACLDAAGLELKLSPEMLVVEGSIKKIAAIMRSQNIATSKLSTDWIRQDVQKVVKSSFPAEVFPKFDNNRRDVPNANKPASVLLTGATGFLGSRLLAHLVRNGRRVICLVRAKNDVAAKAKLLRALSENLISMDDWNWSQIDVVCGDVSRSNLGLDLDLYLGLVPAVTHVIHSAAQVNSVLPYASLRDSNVLGSCEVAKFAAQADVEKFDYISTLSVFVSSDCHAGTLFEHDDLSRIKEVTGGYAQSKFAAELLMRELENRDLFGRKTVRYFRLGLLTADTTTGHYPPADLLTMTLQGILELGAIPLTSRPLRVDITPVDYAAEMILLASNSQTKGSTFHIAHPTGLLIQELMNAMRRANPQLELVTPEEFRNRLANTKISPKSEMACRALSDSMLLDEFPKLMDLFQSTGATFDQASCVFAQENDIQPPILNEQFLDKMILSIVSNQL